jgi:7,8-dihydropterin-6-yl-methyl-4-(beta-D-ribofuranosyl)aminobenzene 5'-phosphate synthase
MTIARKELRITIVVDDRGGCELVGEKGFAAWIEGRGQKILFDTGQGQALLPNAVELGCDLSLLDALVLSHGHYDHSGAVIPVLDKASACRLYCHAQAVVPRYSVRPDEAPRLIAVAAADREAIFALPRERVYWVDGPLQIASGVYLSGPIPRRHPLEDTGGPFFLDIEGCRADVLDDDMALGITTDHGLIIVTGCCHAGLVNTVEQMRSVTGVDTVFGILGGLHLMNASRARLDATCTALRQWQPEFIVPCHCTGEEAMVTLRERLGASVVSGHAGLTLGIAESGGVTIQTR